MIWRIVVVAAMMAADEGFDYPELFAGDRGDAAADDDKLFMDIDSILSVLNEDRDASEVRILKRGLSGSGFCAFVLFPTECAKSP